MNRHAFTLIELLVVITVVGILTAIALPVLNSITQTRLQMQCVAHARQLATSNLAYQADNNGRICSMGQVAGQGGEAASNWMTRIRPYYAAGAYANIRMAFMCPAHPKFVQDNAAHVGWAFNTLLAPTAADGEARIARIEQPANTIYAVDGYRDFDWDAGDGQSTTFTVPTAPQNNYPAGKRVFFPHRRKTVAIFLDGHNDLLSAPIPRNLWTLQK